MEDIDKILIETAILLGRQKLLTDIAINHTRNNQAELEESLKNGTQSIDEVLELYHSTYSLIDHLVRYYKIAFKLPKISHKREEFKELEKSLGNLKQIRNQIQHINNDIKNDFSGPLMGAICWGHAFEQYMVSFHDVTRSRTSPGVSFDTEGDGFPKHFTYIYNGAYYDLDASIDGMNAFSDFISASLKIEVDNKEYLPEEHFLALKIQITPREAD